MKTLVCATVLAAAAIASVEAAFPRPQGRVNDFAGVIDPTTAGELSRLIHETETLTSAEIAVVTVTSLDGMSIEEYAVKLFAEWGIGKKGKDNGVLMLVAPAERRVRIEVGYGLEPILPDALAGRIIRQECLPAFRDNQYSRGILLGVRRLTGIIQRRETLPASERSGQRTDDEPPAYLLVPFFGVFVALGAFAAGIGLRTRARSALLFAGLFLLVPLLVVVLTRAASSFMLIAIGAVMAAVGYRKGASPFWIKTMRGSAEPMNDASPWVSGSSGSGSSDGGSSSGGDFGGGSSGGGGASGSW